MHTLGLCAVCVGLQQHRGGRSAARDCCSSAIHLSQQTWLTPRGCLKPAQLGGLFPRQHTTGTVLEHRAHVWWGDRLWRLQRTKPGWACEAPLAVVLLLTSGACACTVLFAACVPCCPRALTCTHTGIWLLTGRLCNYLPPIAAGRHTVVAAGCGREGQAQTTAAGGCYVELVRCENQQVAAVCLHKCGSRAQPQFCAVRLCVCRVLWL